MGCCDVVERSDVEKVGDQQWRNNMANGPQNGYR